MKYYWLIPSTGDDIGKASSQVKGMKEGYDLYADNSVWKIPYFESPKIEPNFDALQLNNTAKITDIIFATGLVPNTGFFLNEKVKDLLKDFKLPNHIYYKAIVLHKNKVYDNYYWVQFTQEMSDLIDFDNSIFDLKRAFGWQEWIEVENNMTFKNKIKLIEFYYAQSSMNRIIPQSLNLINKNHELQIFSYFANKLLISEKLKSTLEINKINGIELIEL